MNTGRYNRKRNCRIAKREVSEVKNRIRRLISKVYNSGAHSDVHEVTSRVLNVLGLSDEWSNFVDIEVRNIIDRDAFKNTTKEGRILFLPHCLRDPEKCKGEYGDEGLMCAGCGACIIPEIVEKAKEIGYGEVYVVPGGSLVYKILSEKEPEAVIGVACYDELDQAIKKASEKNIPSQGVLLTKTGCVNTETNKHELLSKLKL
ncbi:hypothetical protein C9439_08145 [archaeon SCG-AAA382B04]|nr:hypothetical protein C9439_08145 [archaeon SCG-AAA382B04]